MGDSTGSDNRHPGHADSPLRIFTRTFSADQQRQHRREDLSPLPRENTATNSLLNSAFSRPYDNAGSSETNTQTQAANAAVYTSSSGGSPATSSATTAGQQYSGAGVSASLTSGGVAGRLTRKPTKFVPRVGGSGAQYYPLPSSWRETDAGSLSSPATSSGLASPVTPDGAMGDEAMGSASTGPRSLPHASRVHSEASSPLAIETSRSFQTPRDNQQQQQQQPKTQKPVAQSPVVSPRAHVGMLRDAFDSASSLDWQNDRPASTYSYQSIDHHQQQHHHQQQQVPQGYSHEGQAESPVDTPAKGSRFPPALSSMAVRPSGMRGGLGLPQQQHAKHQASASTSSSHYSLVVNSPPIRGTSPLSTGSTVPSPPAPSAPFSPSSTTQATVGFAGEAVAANGPGTQGEDIVRRYFAHHHQQRRVATSSGILASAGASRTAAPDPSPPSPSSAPSSATQFNQQQDAVAERKPTGAAQQAQNDEHPKSIGANRRALSSDHLPGLEEDMGGINSYLNTSTAGSKSFLAPDLVESPLEALVRRLTVELFQLYVSEDRKKSGGQDQQKQQQQQKAEANQQRKASLASISEENASTVKGGYKRGQLDNPPDDSADYIQQFRLGPSMRSGSTTPAVTLDGYFTPQKKAASESNEGAKPRPRHRLVQRTWMEEALIKARRVSTIDEHAEESILQGLDQAIARSTGASPILPPTLAAAPDISTYPSPLGSEDLAQFSSSDSLLSQQSAQRGGIANSRGLRSSPEPSGLTTQLRGATQQQQMGSERVQPRPRLNLARLDEAPFGSTPDPHALDAISQLVNDRYPKSPRGLYRARDPAAQHRKMNAEKRNKEHLLNISPARASLLRAVGRRQSIRLQPGKGKIVVAETELGTRPSSTAIGAIALDDPGRSTASAPVTLDPDALARAKRSNSLPGVMQVPETKEVSYEELQKKAARQVEFKKAFKSRARVVHRAERMALGGSLPSELRAGDAPGSHGGGRRRHGHKRAGSRAEMDMQLLKVELPPPVPLRVRREQVKQVPEPLIIVRRPSKKPKQEGKESAEQELLRVHNQLLGAQALLSRHNTMVARRNITPTKPTNRFSMLGPQMLARPSGSAGAVDIASGTEGGRLIDDGRPGVKNAVRNEALDVVMLDNALNDRIESDEQQRFAEEDQRRRKTRQGDAQGRAAGAGSDVQEVKHWRSARTRSTLRKKGRSQPSEHSASAAAIAAEVPVPRSLAPQARRLLLHGPVYRIYSGIKARPDTYLFLFTDMLVVTTRVHPSQQHLGYDPMSQMVMAPPSPDANTIPNDSRFKVHIIIPLARSITSLIFTREGGSKRAGEDDEAEESRLNRQEERIRRACHLFEKNTSEAVVYLINRDIIEPVPELIAGFLYRCTALSRRQLGYFLGTGILGENLHENPTLDEVDQEKQFHRQIWISFLDRCDLVGMPIDEALRSVLFYVRLPNNPRSISVLLEVLALQWYVKNIEQGQSSDVFLPDSQDVAVKLAFAIMTLNTELHNPLLRGEIQPEVAFRDLAAKFRAAVVDDPAVAGKRKGNVLRKRDQLRVVTIMEVPTENLKAIFERVAANRLVTCSDARPAAPEFDIDWVRDASDINAPALTDDQIAHEIEDVYSDPGFRDGLVFNASSDRLPAKFNISPPAWVRVTVRIPEPDAKFSIKIRVVGAAGSSGGGGDVVSVAPSPRLSFRASNAASFIIQPRQIGHFTMHFVSEGSHARYYHPIPSRTMVVEGAFMQNTVQVSWKRGDGQGHKARHMFGMDSQLTKSQWARCLEAALKNMSGTPSREVARSVERATASLLSLSSSAAGDRQQKANAADGSLSRPEPPAVTRSLSGGEQGMPPLQILSALGTI
ncbi:hypothetical protein GGI12_000568 [Dipsacomyces acuminosporus]|nr:hypothetical protein GGI12_000568 [Dipsacomyces acuminosporus]